MGSEWGSSSKKNRRRLEVYCRERNKRPKGDPWLTFTLVISLPDVSSPEIEGTLAVHLGSLRVSDDAEVSLEYWLVSEDTCFL